MTGYMAPSNEALIHSTTEPKDELRKGHRYTEKLASDWWKHWIESYLLKLQER